ncbi:Adaptive-response sensory-kinase SasA [Paraburkholderia ultramafica]|uniref:histidine kinase n=2 Tax=Paraburkholderia ultramafica TaxID=1544867 RepID=A0A6S7CGS1_9BURK|nr:Adaptive-response sensory-kinase SasA [Paraburkholderia ultramafica]
MGNSPSLQILWDDGERVFCRGQRPGDGGDNVLIVRPAADHPSPASLDRLAHEFRLKDELDGAWAVRPLELVRDDGRTLLMLEDPGGEPLERLLGAPMEMESVLRLAVGIAAALSRLHQRGLVHKDVKPAHIVLNCPDGRTRLTGFGIASRLPRERQTPEPPETIAGTLAYMAPEQTGRMNRSIDSRSDLYAFGVVLYQMLTGMLPFAAADPMEWVHCHIARKPVPPSERLETIPAPVSHLVMKLLAKTAEERYQTAAGVERDLRRCLVSWEHNRQIDPFPLGEHDTPDRLLIPEKLYGREREVKTLLAAFDRVVSSGATELVLVSGYSGIGKSAVVNELHKVLVPPRGLFASGKFDQYKRDIPYSTLVQAFQSLVRPLLGKRDTELASWRVALLEALGPNARLMTDLIPELKLIIGDPPPVPELEPQQAQRRFQLVFRRFIGVFARPVHPLALFLDDLQWLDVATLDLLEDLLTRSDLQHLMLIGAYRNNEVDATHPLRAKLQAIRNTGARIDEIKLGPLARQHIERLIADALHCEPERAASLAQLVQQKTAGNPFFVTQFLYTLAEENLLTFDHDAACWRWDPDRIRAQRYTENVVDLMVGKVTRLPAETQPALQQLACLGNVASITMLSIVLETAEEQVHASLWPAVRQELVERLETSYRFVHDRVQEAAYSLIPEALRAEAHLRIGRLLAAQTPPEKREEAIFDIVGQLNRGAALITEQDEREQLAGLNLIAGERAKGATAFASALTYLSVGAALTAQDCWTRRRELVFALELNRAECEFLTGDHAAAEARLNGLSTRAEATIERALVACLRLDLYTTLGQSSRAVDVGLDYFRYLGVEWSPNPTDEEVRREYERFWSQLGSRTIEDLIDQPLMTDPASLATMDVLTKIVSAAVLRHENLYSLAMCWAVNLSLEQGNGDGSCATYVQFGCIAGTYFGDYKTAFRFGRLGCELVERRGLKRFQARTYLVAGCHLIPYAMQVRTARDLLHRGFEIANHSGDLMYMGWYRCYYLIENLLAAGDPLIEVQREAEHGLAFAQKMQLGHVIDVIPSSLGLVRTLRGLTLKFGSFSDEQFDELQVETRLASNPELAPAECWYRVRKLQAHFYAGDYTAAVQAASRAERLHPLLLRLLFTAVDYRFFGALSHAASCDGASAGERQQHLDAVVTHHKQLQAWAEYCPENFESRAALVAAEIARIEDRNFDAMRLYEQAIRSARANGFVQNEALANELAARFYAGCGFERFAQVCLRDAHYCYQRWGADGKVRQLEERYPHLWTESRAPASTSTSTIGAPIDHLDLATVIKVSQAVSGDIVLEKLIEMVMRTAIEQGGAERGLLILLEGGERRIAAEATTSGETVTVQLRDEPVSGAVLPQSILYHVLRTRESVILDDAAAEPPFATDPYIRQHRARSILCLPLMNQARLTGALYLENNLTTRVFTSTGIAVLRLVASQAAIVLEDARLYRDLAEREAKIRRLVDANIIGIVVWNAEGELHEANDAFLRMVGYERDDLVSGRVRWTDLTPPEWCEVDERALAEIGATGRAQPFEKEYIRKDGSRVPVVVGPTSFEPGGKEGVAFVLDLTERKRAERALQDSEELKRKIIESSSDCIQVLDLDGNLLFMSNCGQQLLEIDNIQSYLNTRWVDFWQSEDRPKISEAIAAARAGGIGKFQAFCPSAKGAPHWWEVITTPICNADGQPEQLLSVSRDITERKRAEAEAHESERRYHEVQTELAHANRVATMGQLAASITHEVNQPIAATVTNAQAGLRWLSTQPPDVEEVRQVLHRIVNDGNRAGDVLGRIRSLIKKAPPRKGSLDIHAAIREVIELTRGEAWKHGASVQTQLAERLPLIEGDRVQLQQVVLNLVINAIEAMSGISDGVRELLISTGSADSGCVLVAVSDSGPGFAPDSAERIFAPFYTTKSAGLGMGLSICRSIIEAHGGRLWASANEPRGATFQFTVPAHPDASS